MENQKELITLVEKQISNLEEYISSISIIGIEKIRTNKNIVRAILETENINFLKEIKLDELISILPESFNSDLTNLDFYIKSLNTSYGKGLSSFPQVIEEIKQILSRILEYLNVLEKESIRNNQAIEHYSQVKAKLIVIKDKISKNKRMTTTEIDILFEVLNRIQDKQKVLELLIYAGEMSLNNELEVTEDESFEDEEIIENEDLELSKQQIIEVFQKHRLDFYKLQKRDQNSLIKSGDYKKIDELLDIFDKYEINLSSKYGEESILNLKSLAITEILLYSNKEVLDNMFKTAVDNKIMIPETDRIDIMLLLKHPARFIQKKRRYHLRGGQKVYDIHAGELVGCSDDFFKNLEYFTSRGIDAKEFYKISNVPELPHRQILNNQNIFDFYGIDKMNVLKTLSCFSSTNPADTIDQYIELGYFNYISNNLSLVNFGPEDHRCYKLAYALKYTDIPPQKLFTQRGGISLKILEENEEISGLNADNWENKLNRYIPFKDQEELINTYEKAIRKNNTLDTSLAENSPIIKSLDAMFLEEDRKPEVYNFGATMTPNGYVWKINISRNKVLRIYSILMKEGLADDTDSIVYAITRNSILSEEEYNIIENGVKSIKQRRGY